MLELLVKNIFLNQWTYEKISLIKNRSTLDAYKYFSHQTLPGFSTPNGSSDPPLPRFIMKPCANLRENSLFHLPSRHFTK